MRRLFSLKDAVIIIALSIVFSYVSWWTLFTTEKAKQVVRQDISQSLEEGKDVSLTNLPSKVILPIIAYFPFWAITFGLIRVFTNLEKRRASNSPLQQQTL
jgi:hypothetical protein